MTATRADALEVMTLVAACHRRTAPRMDDEQAMLATAEVWAELFTAQKLRKGDLLAAVKLRAQSEPDAPEPADIIRHALKIRRERAAGEPPTDEYERLCESKAENAAELAAIRRQRELDPPAARPQLAAALTQLATAKAIPDA